MSAKTYYQILGVAPAASQQEIESAYRKIVLENHPDLYPGDKEKEERLKQANEAYAVLKDPEKRKEYDLTLREGKQTMRGASAAQRRTPTPSGANPFSEMFQRMHQQAQYAAGDANASSATSVATTEYELRLTPDEARLGTVKIVKVNGRPVKLRIPPGIKDGATLPLIVRIRISR